MPALAHATSNRPLRFGLTGPQDCRVITPEPARDIVETGDEEGSGLRAAGAYPAGLRMEACPVDATVRGAKAFDAGGLGLRAIHLFTLRSGFVPRMVGQRDLIF